MSRCNNCYRGTCYGYQCVECAGTGHVSTIRWGPLELRLANFWKINTHKRWASGEPDGISLKRDQDNRLIVVTHRADASGVKEG